MFQATERRLAQEKEKERLEHKLKAEICIENNGRDAIIKDIRRCPYSLGGCEYQTNFSLTLGYECRYKNI